MPGNKQNFLTMQGLHKTIKTELKMYSEEVIERVNAASEKAVKELVKETIRTAPELTGDFACRIGSQELDRNRLGNGRYIWYVRRPDYRITHLLVHGHRHPKGRTRADPFLEESWDRVRKQYEKDVEEALKYD